MAQKRPLEEAQVGEELGPIRYKVSEKLVKKSVELVDEPHPWYLSNSPFGGPIVPPLIIASDYIRAWSVKFFGEEPIHTKAEHHYINPAKVGKELIVTGKVTDRYNKRGRDYLVFETVTKDEDGLEIVRSKNTLLINL